MGKKNDGSGTVNGLKDFATWPTNDPAVLGVELTDTKGRSLAAAVNGWGLADIVEQCLTISLLPTFAAATNMASGSESPPTIHTDGTLLELKSGRSPKEVAATMTVGCQRLVVFLPLAVVLQAVSELAQEIETDTGPGPH